MVAACSTIMPPFGSIKRKELVKALRHRSCREHGRHAGARRQAGFEGPFAGGKHEFLVKGELRLVLPSPHPGEISKELLGRILRQANISRAEREKL